MQYFHLDQALDEMVLCDREDCDGIADYLEVDDDGRERRLCGLHTRSEKYSALLPMRTPSPDPPYCNRVVIYAVPMFHVFLHPPLRDNYH